VPVSGACLLNDDPEKAEKDHPGTALCPEARAQYIADKIAYNSVIPRNRASIDMYGRTCPGASLREIFQVFA
jgi:hypothetical protein